MHAPWGMPYCIQDGMAAERTTPAGSCLDPACPQPAPGLTRGHREPAPHTKRHREPALRREKRPPPAEAATPLHVVEDAQVSGSAAQASPHRTGRPTSRPWSRRA